MKKKYLIFLIIFIFLGLNFSYSQENLASQDSLSKDDEINKSVLLDNIKYDASDSIRIDQKNNKILLYNNAKIVYGDITLTSGLIILDYKENIVTAGRIADLKGNLSVQSWIQASKERLKELDEQEGEKQLCLNF